jgi:hypothetical protein
VRCCRCRQGDGERVTVDVDVGAVAAEADAGDDVAALGGAFGEGQGVGDGRRAGVADRELEGLRDGASAASVAVTVIE